MGATDYTTLIARARVECNDTEGSNPHFGETPAGVRDAVNTVFRLLNPNPVASTLYYTYGATPRSQAGFAVLDGPSGYISITTAPDAGDTQPFFFDYFSLWFLDADYQKMIDGATEDLGGVAGQAIDAGLTSALIQFVLARFWKRRASTYANQYATDAGGASAAPESVSSQYLALAKVATSEGIRLMTAFYTRHGKRNAPASGTITNRISPYTPRR